MKKAISFCGLIIISCSLWVKDALGPLAVHIPKMTKWGVVEVLRLPPSHCRWCQKPLVRCVTRCHRSNWALGHSKRYKSLGSPLVVPRCTQYQFLKVLLTYI